MSKAKRLSDTELEIMMTIWDAGKPLTSVQIRDKMKESRNWTMGALMTALARMVEKGFLQCDKSTGINVYKPLVDESEYKSQEGKSFLEKLFGNSVPNLVTNLYASKIIDKSDIEELRALLDKLEGGGEN